MWPVGPSLVHLFEAGNLQVLWACWTWGILGLYVGNLRIEGGGAGFASRPQVPNDLGDKMCLTRKPHQAAKWEAEENQRWGDKVGDKFIP